VGSNPTLSASQVP